MKQEIHLLTIFFSNQPLSISKSRPNQNLVSFKNLSFQISVIKSTINKANWFEN